MNKDDRILNAEGRVPPQAVEVEEAVLGSMLIEGEALLMGLDRANRDDFYKLAHQHIFDALKFLHEQEGYPDMLAVEQYLRDKGLLASCGGAGYLSELTRSVSSAANIDYHIQILNEKALKRKLILGADDIIREAYDSESDPYDLMDRWKRIHERLEQISYLKVPKSANEAIKEVLTDAITGRNVNDQGIVGLPTYLPIDRLTAGFPSGHVSYIAGRPSMGKTAYLLTIIMNQILAGYDKPILLFSFEMQEQMLLLRLLCMMAKVDMHMARRGRLNNDEKHALVNAAEYLGVKMKFDGKEVIEVSNTKDCILFIEDNSRNTVQDIGAKARMIATEYGLGWIAADYLQLVKVKNTKEKNIGTREQEVAYISGSLKGFAEDFDVPFIALSQLSRAVESRSGDNRPQLSDLRESGSIEQDAEMILFLYRPEYYKINRTEAGVSTKGMAEIILAKNRNGPTGMEKHLWLENYAIFQEWDHEREKAERSNTDNDLWMQGKHDPGEDPQGIDEDLPF